MLNSPPSCMVSLEVASWTLPALPAAAGGAEQAAVFAVTRAGDENRARRIHVDTPGMPGTLAGA